MRKANDDLLASKLEVEDELRGARAQVGALERDKAEAQAGGQRVERELKKLAKRHAELRAASKRLLAEKTGTPSPGPSRASGLEIDRSLHAGRGAGASPGEAERVHFGSSAPLGGNYGGKCAATLFGSSDGEKENGGGTTPEAAVVKLMETTVQIQRGQTEVMSPLGPWSPINQ